MQAKLFLMLYVSCVVCAGPIPISYAQANFFFPMLHALIALKTLSYVQAKKFCASVLSSEPGLSKTLSRAASFAGASILRLHLHLTRVTKIPSCGGQTRRGSRTRARTRPRRQRMLQFCLLWAGRAAAPHRRRQRWLWRESQTLNLLPLINGVLWDTEVRLQFAIAGCNRPDRIGLDSNMTYTMLRQWPSRSQTIPDYLRISQINQS